MIGCVGMNDVPQRSDTLMGRVMSLFSRKKKKSVHQATEDDADA